MWQSFGIGTDRRCELALSAIPSKLGASQFARIAAPEAGRDNILPIAGFLRILRRLLNFVQSFPLLLKFPVCFRVQGR